MASLPATLCAITFQGNASNGLQQDAFYFIDGWHYEKLGITPVSHCPADFCVAVADGVAESPLSEYASKAVVKTVHQLWQAYQTNPHSTQILPIEAIYNRVATLSHRYHGAMSTLALLYWVNGELVIKHIGDSRVYHFCHLERTWLCLTRDHNVLNELIDEQANSEGRTVNFAEYNRDGMARSLYALTDCLIVDSDLDNNPLPTYGNQVLTVQAGDALVVCTDGVYDLVPCNEWQAIDSITNLQDWLKQLRKQIYASDGNAYDNATAIVVRFDE